MFNYQKRLQRANNIYEGKRIVTRTVETEMSQQETLVYSHVIHAFLTKVFQMITTYCYSDARHI